VRVNRSIELATLCPSDDLFHPAGIARSIQAKLRKCQLDSALDQKSKFRPSNLVVAVFRLTHPKPPSGYAQQALAENCSRP
jgi:hypothetical protein